MTLHTLPLRTAGAAENMALDFLLLQRYPAPAADGVGRRLVLLRQSPTDFVAV